MHKESQSIVYLGDSAAADEHHRWLVNAGMSVLLADCHGEFKQQLVTTQPAAVVVDLSMGESEISCIEAVTGILSDLNTKPGIVFLSARADQEVRLRAIQAGGRAFLSKPVTPQVLMQHLEPALLSARLGYRVLLVGDASGLLAEYVPVLEQAGMTVKHLRHISQSLLSVINFSPDVLILQQTLADCRGDELGRMFHQLEDYEDLPVIYFVHEGERTDDRCLDHASEWFCPGSVSHAGLTAMIDRMVSTAGLRKSRINHLHTCDPVTGVVNRQGFFKVIERGFNEAATALTLIDFENLQQQFPQLSPQAMNQLLVIIATQIGKLMAPVDLIARISDYTFACILTGRTRDEINQLAQTLGHSLTSRIFDVEQHSLTVGCSVGIAVTGERLEDNMSLFTLAMRACDEARQAHIRRVRVHFLESNASKRSRYEQQLLSLLANAVEDRRLRLVYQPIASLRGSAVEIYEVLLRMLNDDNELIPPAHFVPLAERNGMMQIIDRWVIAQTLHKLQFRANGTRFFVKIASSTLGDPGFLPFLKNCLQRYPAPGRQLVFALSAANLNSGIRQAADFSKYVIGLECGVSIEHHDISQEITRMFEYIPANYVKLAGDAIRDLENNPDMQLQLKSVIQQSIDGKAQVIAAFVESAACLQLLWQSGVHYIQGNFLQEPDAELSFDFGGGYMEGSDRTRSFSQLNR